MQKLFIKAFTIAEILIVLVIVGIIAAMTVPSLVLSVERAKSYSGLMKAYSDLSQAAMEIRRDNGGNFAYAVSSNATLAQAFQNKFKIIESDFTGANPKSFYSVVMHTLDGRNYGSYSAWLSRPEILTTDGFVYTFYLSNSACNTGSYGIADFCGVIFADINGDKAPNTAGKDIFFFSLTNNGLKPYNRTNFGVYECSMSDTTNVVNGYECGAKALLEGKVTYY